jgi:hypothetical protein
MTTFSGGCLCRAIRYEASGKPKFSLSCHCRDCQYVSGGAPTHAVLMPSDAVQLLKGTPKTFWSLSDTGNRVARLFCENCGTPLFAHSPARPDIMAIKVGSLDDPSWFRPQANIWVSSAQPWSQLDADIPQFRNNPKPGLRALLSICKAFLLRVGRKAGFAVF